MGNLAASGGYFVAAAADRIVAQPGTITGSIGVISGKVSLRELWADLGVNWDGVQAGRRAAMWSANAPFSRDEWEWLQRNRSEEHTSELQSLMSISYAVFCLKKKT